MSKFSGNLHVNEQALPTVKEDKSGVVFVTKCASRWHEPLFRFLRKTHGPVRTIFVNEEMKSRNLPSHGKPLVDRLKAFVDDHEPELLIFDLEFSLLLSPWEVAAVSSHASCKSFGIAMDDDRFHDINRLIYSGVDAVLTHPLSVERYRLINYRAYDFFPSFELCRSNDNDRTHEEVPLDIDVLSYGLLKSDRRMIIDELERNGINVVHPDFDTSDEELNNLIKRSKIVINLSGGSAISSNPIQFLPFVHSKSKKFQTRQLKSRIYEVASLGSLCVSEKFAGDQLVFNGDSLLTVENNIEMVKKIQCLLGDKAYFDKEKNRFLNTFNNLYGLEKRIKDFQAFTSNIKPQVGLSFKSSVLLDASCLATKSIYSKNLRPILFRSEVSTSISYSFSVKVVAISLLIFALCNKVFLKNEP